MTTGVKKPAIKGSKPQTISVDQLKIDDKYQRGVVNRHKKIISDFNPAAMGRIIVGRRDDGSLWVVDGQQRLTAVKALGRKTIDCEVFSSDGPEHEAQIFKLINKNRTALHALEIFQALLVGTDTTAWQIKEVLEKHGFNIPKSSTHFTRSSDEKKSKSVLAVSALQRMYRAAGSVDGIDFVLGAVSKIWNDDPLRTRESILLGLHALWLRRKGVIDMDRLVNRLGQKQPSELIYSAGLGVGSRSMVMSQIMEKLYRKHR